MPKKPQPKPKLNTFQQVTKLVSDSTKEYAMFKLARKKIKSNLIVKSDEAGVDSIHINHLIHKMKVTFLNNKKVFTTGIHTHPGKEYVYPSCEDIFNIYTQKFDYGAIYNYHEKISEPVGCIVFGIKDKKLFEKFLTFKTSSYFNTDAAFKNRINSAVNARYYNKYGLREIPLSEKSTIKAKMFLDVYKEIGINWKFVPNDGYRFNKKKMMFEKGIK